MKKIVSLVLILVIGICMMGSAYAASNCDISINTATEYSKNDEIVAEVNISNIQSENGIIALSATLEYDKDSLTLVKMEGQNGWSNPSINDQNGKFAMDRNLPVKNNETVLKITFKVKETSKKNLSITLKNASIGDGGDAPGKVGNAVKNITIEGGTENETPTTPGTENGTTTIPGTENGTPTTPGTENGTPTTPGTTTSGTNNKNETSATSSKGNTNKNVTASKKLPKAGSSSIILMIVIGCLILVSILSYIKIKKINK